MRAFSILSVSSVAAFVTMGVTAGANANTYIIEQPQSHYIACYKKVYVPARVLVNTRGKLVRAANNSWEVSGDAWDYVRNPPVYIQTEHVVEPDHYTLVSGGCP